MNWFKKKYYKFKLDIVCIGKLISSLLTQIREVNSAYVWAETRVDMLMWFCWRKRSEPRVNNDKHNVNNCYNIAEYPEYNIYMNKLEKGKRTDSRVAHYGDFNSSALMPSKIWYILYNAKISSCLDSVLCKLTSTIAKLIQQS